MKEMISCVYAEYSEQKEIKSNFPIPFANKMVNEMQLIWGRNIPINIFFTKRVLPEQTHYIKIFFHSISVLINNTKKQIKGKEMANEMRKAC